MNGRTLWFLRALLLCLCFGVPAFGAEGGDAQLARERMDRGQALFTQSKFEEALAEFEGAYQVLPYTAFLYNAAVAAERAKDRQRAILRYTEYLEKESGSSDAEEIRGIIARLQKELAEPPPEVTEGAAPVAVDVAATPPTGLRSLVVVESDPPGAPLAIFERVDPGAPRFKEGAENPGWQRTHADRKTPTNFSLPIGHYHVVIEKFQDYHRSETDINVVPGHVYNFKANLSQGEFLAFVRVTSNVEGAKIYLDDPPPHKNAPWGRVPHSGLVNMGEHQLWIESSGYEPSNAKFFAEHGETSVVNVALSRVGYGGLLVDGNADEIDVEVNGQPSGTFVASGAGAPLRVQLPAGKHWVSIDASGRKAYEGEVTVPHGQDLSVHATLVDSPPITGAILAGVGAVGAGVGGYFLLQRANTLEDDAANAETNKEREDLESERGLMKGFSTGAFIGGGVLAAVSIFLFIYDPYPDSMVRVEAPKEFDAIEKPAVTGFRVTPAISYDAGGLFAAGRF